MAWEWYDDITSSIAEIVDDSISWVDDTWNDVSSWADSSLDDVISWVDDTWNDVTSWVDDTYTTYITPVVDWVDEAIDWGIEIVSGYLDTAENDGNEVDEYIDRMVYDPDEGIINPVIDAVDDVISFITGGGISIPPIITNVFDFALDPLGGILKSLIDDIGKRMEVWIANALGVEIVK